MMEYKLRTITDHSGGEGGEGGDDHSLDKRKNNPEKLVPLVDRDYRPPPPQSPWR